MQRPAPVMYSDTAHLPQCSKDVPTGHCFGTMIGDSGAVRNRLGENQIHRGLIYSLRSSRR